MVKEKPVPKSQNSVKQDLLDIENKLSEYARKGKSVFLYGKDSADRKIIVKEISKSIFKKRKSINCQRMDGEDVYKKLTNSHDGVLFKHAGSLFVDNLHCNPKSKEDFKYYNKLTKVIRERNIAVKWLVVYASKRKSFPDYFKRQFKMISLESETVKSTGKVSDNEGRKRRKQRIPDKKFKQLCKEVKKECSIEQGKKMFFNQLSKMSTSNKYDSTGKGYTPKTARKKYYEVFSS